jgi:hypothetical protein
MGPSRTRHDHLSTRYDVPHTTQYRDTQPGKPARRYQRDQDPPPTSTLAIPKRRHENMEQGALLAGVRLQHTAKVGVPSVEQRFVDACSLKTKTSFVGPGGLLYSSPTSSVLPGIPPEDNTVKFLEPCWPRADALYTPFLPHDPDSVRTADPIMSVWTLHICPDLLVEETTKGYFRPLHADRMLELENDLLRLLEALLLHLNTVLDIRMVHVVKPRDMANYILWGTDRHNALQRAYLAICGGLRLSSTISLLIANLWAVSKKRDRWLEVLTDVSTAQIGRPAFKPEFLDMVKSSSLNNFDVPRVGVFVDIRTCSFEYLKWIPGMILANVPVIFRWTAQLANFKPLQSLEWAVDLLGPEAAGVSTAGPIERTRPMIAPNVPRNPHLLWQTPRPEGSAFLQLRPREMRLGETLFEYFSNRKCVQQSFLQHSTKVEREWCRWNAQIVMQPPYSCIWDDVVVWTKDIRTGRWSVMMVPKTENRDVLSRYSRAMGHRQVLVHGHRAGAQGELGQASLVGWTARRSSKDGELPA